MALLLSQPLEEPLHGSLARYSITLVSFIRRKLRRIPQL
jgi:hypothetical protein